MRYALVFRDAGAAEAVWEVMSDDEQDKASDQIGCWFVRHADRIRHSRHLRSVVTATTLRWSAGEKASLVDGPFGSESAAVSGYIEVEVTRLEEAIDMLRNWPFDTLVEIRAIA
ncbi:YciI family protein [Streptosporangium sp. CA-115845]|uniref:YciI family protein n=1 Tax=Streptosporangium sp. CA-115845 TaxID=3240071 RepID=UPI003D8B27ED